MGSKIRDEKLGCLTKKPMANDWLAPDYAGRKKDGRRVADQDRLRWRLPEAATRGQGTQGNVSRRAAISAAVL